MRIGIMGGTYNPPHIGHISAAKGARNYLKLDKIIFIPASIPPHKKLPRGTPLTQQRLEMAKIAAETINADVLDIEINRGGISYTSDTLIELNKIYPDSEFWLIVGTDMLLTIQDWHNPKDIFKSANIAVASRGTDDPKAVATHIEYLREEFNANVELIAGEIIEISSSQLRNMLPDKEAGKYLPNGVYDYIIKNKLYF